MHGSLEIVGKHIPATPLIPASFPLGPRWHVVFTNIRCEFRANMGLKAKGFETFLPTLKKRIRHSRYTREVERPLFSRYLFVRFDLERDEWFYPIKTTDGVEDLLSNDLIPVRVPDTAINGLMAAQQAGEFDLTRRTKHPAVLSFKKGETIRVSDGPFVGFNAKVLATLPDKDRVEVLLNIFGRMTPIELDPAQLQKL